MSKPIFSNDNFINWLERKDPTEVYRYDDMTSCCIAQYLQELGFRYVKVDIDKMMFVDHSGRDIQRRLPQGWDEVAKGMFNETGAPYETFGAALRRARRVLVAA